MDHWGDVQEHQPVAFFIFSALVFSSFLSFSSLFLLPPSSPFPLHFLRSSPLRQAIVPQLQLYPASVRLPRSVQQRRSSRPLLLHFSPIENPPKPLLVNEHYPAFGFLSNPNATAPPFLSNKTCALRQISFQSNAVVAPVNHLPPPPPIKARRVSLCQQDCVPVWARADTEMVLILKCAYRLPDAVGGLQTGWSTEQKIETIHSACVHLLQLGHELRRKQTLLRGSQDSTSTDLLSSLLHPL